MSNENISWKPIHLVVRIFQSFNASNILYTRGEIVATQFGVHHFPVPASHLLDCCSTKMNANYDVESTTVRCGNYY